MSTPRAVLLTGATGTMGRETLHELMRRRPEFAVTALVRPSPKNQAFIDEWTGRPGLRLVHGDLRDPVVVARCVAEADVVVHTATFDPYVAEEHPDLARATIVGGMRNIVRAAEARGPGGPTVVNIGTVAETGDRPPPVHWGRIGDPIKVSDYDVYAMYKTIAERELAASRVARWVTLRQTGIFYPELVAANDPIAFHTPLGGVLEWVSAADSARLAAAVCDRNVPEELWYRAWNIGGGPGWRLTNYDFSARMLRAVGVKDLRRWYDRNWFTTGNFHGQWFTDSQELEDLFHFRGEPFEVQFAAAMSHLPASVRFAGRIPPRIVHDHVMRPLTMAPRGPMRWIADGDTERIEAYFGSREAWEAIGDWNDFEPPAPSRTPTHLEHGYDETLDPAAWTEETLRGAAAFRGGALLEAGGPQVGGPEQGLARRVARWTCHRMHEFEMTPHTVLRAGFWCPTCLEDWSAYPDMAKASEFFAQVWRPPGQG